MAENRQQLLKCLAQLQAIRQNFPESGEVEVKYVDHYNSVVVDLENELVDDLSRFKINRQNAHPILTSVSNGQSHYSNQLFYDRLECIREFDGLLIYLNSLLREDKQPIGYKSE